MAECPALDVLAKKLFERDPASVMALIDIATERLRQIEQEGWSVEHDDQHSPGTLSNAAACYAAGIKLVHSQNENFYHLWRWHGEWWKPSSSVRNRIKAAALIMAEMARHYRSVPHGR